MKDSISLNLVRSFGRVVASALARWFHSFFQETNPFIVSPGIQQEKDSDIFIEFAWRILTGYFDSPQRLSKADKVTSFFFQ